MRAGVSVASVSTALNNSAVVSVEMRARIERAAAELDYIPHVMARNLRLGRANLIGLVLPDITNPHFSGLAHAIEMACDAAGYSLMLCNTSDDAEKEMRHVQMLRAHRVRGIILIPGGSRTHDDAALLRLLGDAAVLLDRSFPGLAANAVLLDNVAAGRLVTAHLLDCGHRRIGFIGGPPSLQIARDRIAGCAAALQAHGLELDPALLIDGRFQPDHAYAGTRTLLECAPQLTALVSTNNHTTVGVMQALAHLGMPCPARISVAAIDDFAWAEGFLPRLTAVAQPIVAMGQEAVRRLLHPGSVPETVVLAPDLIVRGSTRPLGDGAAD